MNVHTDRAAMQDVLDALSPLQIRKLLVCMEACEPDAFLYALAYAREES